MRIAQVVPLLTRVPPTGMGGIERIVWYITEELVRRGHDVTLFATGDSHTSARLVPMSPGPLPAHDGQAWMMFHLLMFERVFSEPAEFDLVHSHLDYFVGPFARRHNTPTLTTLHNPLYPFDEPVWSEYRQLPLVAISDAQRREPFPWLHVLDVVYHGIPADLYTLREQPGAYLAFLGRITPEKGLHTAIAIAQEAGVPLRIGGRPDPFHQPYFEEQIRPHLDHPLVEYIGEVNDAQKRDFLGGASALLFPIEWAEPFGLVMIEALACGTPVIAFPHGSVPEVISDGENGFVVRSVAEAVAAVHRLPELSRRRCRETFEARFTVSRMVDGYEAIYRRMLERGT
ncbi:MAG TPA: glycosyltransferase family 4 protein [Roseiflexaceae bacterium]|nr:glycosyltransferase family 4 protein [Roseiflexaceae bacterium]